MFTVWTSVKGYEQKTPNYSTVLEILKKDLHVSQKDESAICSAQYTGNVVNISYGFTEAQVRWEA